jgi:hypothetical protein
MSKVTFIDPYAPKSLRTVPITEDGPPRIPSFLRRNVMNDMPTAAPQNLDELERDLAAEIARRSPRQAVVQGKASPRPLGNLKTILAGLTYGDMKLAASEIGKHADIDADKLADAMHKYATAEDAP